MKTNVRHLQLWLLYFLFLTVFFLIPPLNAAPVLEFEFEDDPPPIRAPSGTRTGSRPEPPEETWTEPHTGMAFVWVPGGCFQMGDTFGDGNSDEKPVHKVCLDGFWLGRYEVTQAEYRKVTRENPSRFKGDRRPVENVSWDDAKKFISGLNRQTGETFALPSEAQWEYAARSGGKPEKYAGGNEVDQVAWYGKNSGRTTRPAGTKLPNALGLYDMSGNVWEWCEDVYDEKAYGKHSLNNPVITSGSSYRVLRGGSWDFSPWIVRAAGRSGFWAFNRFSYVGFRLCRPRVRQ